MSRTPTRKQPRVEDGRRVAPEADSALAIAIEHHRGGRFREAAAGYRDILKVDPDHFDALNLLGVVMNQAGKNEAAVDLIGRAVALKPEFAEAHSNLGNALRDLGRIDDAIVSFGRALSLAPGYAESHYNLGIALIRQGKFAEAADAFREALALKPEFVEARNNLGHALKGDGRLDEAVATYREAIALKPDYAAAHYNLGNALKDQGALDDAVAAYRKAIALKPDYAGAIGNLGNALRDQGLIDQAVASYRDAIAIDPDFADAHGNLGTAYFKQGKFEEATAAFRKAVALRPDSAEAHANLGRALAAWEKLDEAIVSYHRAIDLDPKRAEAHNDLGVALHKQGRIEEAIASHREAIALEPTYAEPHDSLGVGLREQGRLEDAVASHRMAIALKPDFVGAHLHLGETLLVQGKLEEAGAAIRHALGVRPELPEAYHTLSGFEAHQFDDADLVAMQGLVDDAGVSEKDTTRVLFALARAYESRRDYDPAFECFSRGNRLRRRAVEFDGAKEQDFYGRIPEVFSKALLSRFRGAGADSDLPIFIVGMPRSGTTLVEQILASHGDVHGAGEIKDMGLVVSSLPRRLGVSQAFPECVAEADFQQWREVGEAYAKGLGRRAPSKSRITDKLTNNYEFIGLIHLMLPNARVIHCQRDPVDTCLSLYRTIFVAGGGPGYSYDLTELGRHYRLYDQLMRHWRVVLPGKVLDVRYEDVVADLEGSARRIVAHCGLDWSDACLDFHSTDRPVRTVSRTQVRRPIYTSSIGRWRHYERHLGPLLSALGPCVSRPSAPT